MATVGVVLWIHGGGWHSRSTENGAALKAHGLRVVEATYRLSGEAPWPAQFEDVRAAARAAREEAGDLPLFVAGDSAGGHLALHVGLRGLTDSSTVDFAGVMAFWAPIDPLAPDWLRTREDDNPWTALIGHPPAPGDPATMDSSPGTHLGNGIPVLLVHGTEDQAVPASQATAFTSALIAAGHPVHTWITNGGHALDLGRADIHGAIGAFLGTST